VFSFVVSSYNITNKQLITYSLYLHCTDEINVDQCHHSVYFECYSYHSKSSSDIVTTSAYCESKVMSGGLVKLKSLFFGSRPNVSVQYDIGELSVILPEFDKDRDPVLYLEFNKRKTVHFTCPLNSTTLDIKLRVRGIFKIPTERIVLFYRGSVLQDDEVEYIHNCIFMPRHDVHAAVGP
jgi:hypothetical protein